MNFSRIPVETKIRIMGFLVGVAHVVMGISAWVEPSALKVTQLAALEVMLAWAGFSYVGAAAILFATGILAMFGASNHHHPNARIWLFMPQEILLLIQIWSIYWVFSTGIYPDGYMPAGKAWFILSDQFLTWLVAASHTIWLAAFIIQPTARTPPMKVEDDGRVGVS